MITSVRGEVLAVGAGFVTFDMSGFGVRVEVPGGIRAPKAHPGESFLLHTAFIVREDSLTLYGFETEPELEVFQVLMTVTGVGPRSALGVLSALAPAEIAGAVSNEDEKPFRKVSGIGPKTAKLILISLAGKLKHIVFDETQTVTATPSFSSTEEQVIQALLGLGWQENRARDAVAVAVQNMPAEASVQELMREALAGLNAPKGKVR